MAPHTDDLAHNLAHNLTAMRAQRRLSQAQLAHIAGIPRSTVTHMESGAGNPSLNNLAKVAGALQIGIEELLARPRNAISLVTADQIPIKDSGHGRIKVHKLLPERMGGLEMDRLEIRPGGAMPATPHIKGTKEYLYGLKGIVTVLVAGEVHRVASGDLLAFPGDQPHSYRNSERVIADAVSVVIPIPPGH